VAKRTSLFGAVFAFDTLRKNNKGSFTDTTMNLANLKVVGCLNLFSRQLQFLKTHSTLHDSQGDLKEIILFHYYHHVYSFRLFLHFHEQLHLTF